MPSDTQPPKTPSPNSKPLTTVTPFSKFLALCLFLILPTAGFYLGIQYQKSQSLISNQPTTDYQQLANQCSSECCHSSVQTMEEHQYQLAQNSTCPSGLQLSSLRCIDSLQWCQPASNSRQQAETQNESNLQTITFDQYSFQIPENWQMTTQQIQDTQAEITLESNISEPYEDPDWMLLAINYNTSPLETNTNSTGCGLQISTDTVTILNTQTPSTLYQGTADTEGNCNQDQLYVHTLDFIHNDNSFSVAFIYHPQNQTAPTLLNQILSSFQFNQAPSNLKDSPSTATDSTQTNNN